MWFAQLIRIRDEIIKRFPPEKFKEEVSREYITEALDFIKKCLRYAGKTGRPVSFSIG